MKKIVAFCLLFFIISSVFSALLPYPIFCSHTNITEKDALKINNLSEIELSPQPKSEPAMLKLTFKDIDKILPIGSLVEIYDIETKTTFQTVRTGGKNHADVEPIDKMNAQIISDCAQNWSMQRRSVLVILTDTAYLPASLVYYPHGYSSTNNMSGHLCLHFKGSKTDGTNEKDYHHQKAISKASKTPLPMA